MVLGTDESLIKVGASVFCFSGHFHSTNSQFQNSDLLIADNSISVSFISNPCFPLLKFAFQNLPNRDLSSTWWSCFQEPISINPQVYCSVSAYEFLEATLPQSCEILLTVHWTLTGSWIIFDAPTESNICHILLLYVLWLWKPEYCFEKFSVPECLLPPDLKSKHFQLSLC